MGLPQRARLVARLRADGRITSASVAGAFQAVPRHLFLPGLPVEAAYADEAVAIKWVDGVAVSSASQPSMMAIMLEQLDVRPGQRVLEIGAGTGYNAALMANLVGPTGSVVSVDIDAELVSRAEAHLRTAGVSGVELVAGDGALGYPPRAPYDRIVLTVGSGDIRPEWVEQLAPGGRLLLPLTVRGSQLSVALDLHADGVLRGDSVRGCAFIRLRGLGAASAAAVRIGDGLAVQLAEDTTADPDAVRAALARPGPFRRTDVRMGPADLWDGLGLWLALADPAVVRLLAGGDATRSKLGRRMVATGATRGTVALAGTGEGGTGSGLAAVLLDRPMEPGNTRRELSTGVQAFGPAGPVLADRLADLLAPWAARGHPCAADLRVEALPHPRVPMAPPAGSTVVVKPHSQLLLHWATPTR